MRVVISQPMYFPWLGQLNQALLADAFVFYSDVQFARGFINRVQVLIEGEPEFLTVPTLGSKRLNINQLRPDSGQPWVARHTTKLSFSFQNAPFGSYALDIFSSVTSERHLTLSSLNSASVKLLCSELFPQQCPTFYDSTEFPRESKGTQALIEVCQELGATHYLTGHGAKNYVDVELFSRAGIELEFIDYRIRPYIQFGGRAITNYVSALDALARLGPDKTLELFESVSVSATSFASK
jgi:hypothetical protein